MTDNEIIKALECCGGDYACDECPMTFKASLVVNETCGHNLMKLDLDLINRQKAEIQAQNEKLHNRKAEVNRLNSKVRSFKAEIERLKNHIQEGIDLARQIPEMIVLAKAEAYKEFAERLKAEFCKGYTYLEIGEKAFSRDIDNLLKEMVGENNDKR